MRIKNKFFQICCLTIGLSCFTPMTSAAGWVQDDDLWFYLNESGYMHTGWLTDKGFTYYLDRSGVMLTGTQVFGNSYYSFAPTGELLGPSVPVDIAGLDSGLLADGIRQTDSHWAEINHLLDLINQERAAHGSGPLVLDKGLSNIAGYRCSYMEATNHFEHYADGINLSNAAATAYYNTTAYVGENLYYYYTTDGSPLTGSMMETTEQGFQWFLQSPGHYENMMNPSYKKVGLCIYSNAADSRRFQTQIFQ